MDGRNQYPPLTGVPSCARRSADANARFYGLEVDPATEVVVTSGATEAITACLMALLNPGDEVVLIEPLYDTYLPVVRMLGAIPRLVRLVPPRWELPRAELAAAFGPRTKAILLNTPMNPTSKVFTAAELAFIADLLVKHDAYAVCDEVYEHLTYDGWRHIPLMTLPGLRDRCLRMGSAGKTFSLTGWKVGYVTAPASAGPVGRACPPEPHLYHPAQPAACAWRSAWRRTTLTSPRCRAGIGSQAGSAGSAGLTATRPGRCCRPKAATSSAADFTPLGFARRRRGVLPPHHAGGEGDGDPGQRVLRGRCPPALRPLRLLQAGCGAG